MLPRTIGCEECGKTAQVRAYGRVVYDWPPDTGEDDQYAPQPQIKGVRLTIDCPRCGVRTQDFHPIPQHELSR